MKKLLTILISCSLALAASAMAAPKEDASPPPKKNAARPAKEAHPSMNQGRPAREFKPANGAKQIQNPNAMRKAHAAANTPAAPVEAKHAVEPIAPVAPAVATKVHGKDATAHGKPPVEQMKKEPNPPNDAAAANDKQHAEQIKKEHDAAAANKLAVPAPANVKAETNLANPPAPKINAKAKKPDPQVVQKIKIEHANFKAQPKPDKVPTVTFNQSYRIQGADQWQGRQYGAFRSYHPERHDHGWYHSRYPRVEIISGGAYYLNDGYWYPAWGYNPSAEYYAYDGPIYAGSRAEPPDRVIADVQSLLQQEGYYKGDVDGLLGPLTREALTAYQSDNGLYPTAAIDEPTLSSLDLG